ncbi:MAG: hypothetical protein QXK80_03170 [Candidatus Pacearchaeota archaeon]
MPLKRTFYKYGSNKINKIQLKQESKNHKIKNFLLTAFAFCTIGVVAYLAWPKTKASEGAFEKNKINKEKLEQQYVYKKSKRAPLEIRIDEITFNNSLQRRYLTTRTLEDAVIKLEIEATFPSDAYVYSDFKSISEPSSSEIEYMRNYFINRFTQKFSEEVPFFMIDFYVNGNKVHEEIKLNFPNIAERSISSYPKEIKIRNKNFILTCNVGGTINRNIYGTVETKIRERHYNGLGTYTTFYYYDVKGYIFITKSWLKDVYIRKERD